MIWTCERAPRVRLFKAGAEGRAVLGVIVTIAYGIAMLWSLLSFAGGGQ